MNAIPIVQIPLPSEAIREFCRRWNVSEMALFGSVLREDFCADSDVDVMVTFADGSGLTLSRLVHMTEELESLFGHRVDLLTRDNIESTRNYIVRETVLGSAQVIYAAR